MGYDILSVSAPDNSPLAGVVRQAAEKTGGKANSFHWIKLLDSNPVIKAC